MTQNEKIPSVIKEVIKGFENELTVVAGAFNASTENEVFTESKKSELFEKIKKTNESSKEQILTHRKHP